MNKPSLTSNEKQLIEKIVAKRNPELAGQATDVQNGKLPQSVKEALQQILLDEMYENGLGEDDEPNALGNMLDSIIGKLEYYAE